MNMRRVSAAVSLSAVVLLAAGTTAVEAVNFGRQRIFSRVAPIGLLSASDEAALADAMSAGLVDAWLVHLAEGVRLIDATEHDVELVMVGGVAQAGDVLVMSALKAGDFEVVSSENGCFDKAIDVTAPVPHATETLAQISALVADGLRALGGDHPPVGGGPSSPFVNTWSYLKAHVHIPGASALPDLTFNFALVSLFGTPDGKVNLVAITPAPLFTADDHWWFATLEAARDPLTGLTAAVAPPYGPYPSNANQITPSGNPFAAELFNDRWYGVLCMRR